MKIGTVKEIKDDTETRVGLVPSTIVELVELGNEVYIEKRAGEKSGITDSDYEKSGANLISSAKEVWENVDLMVKIKEPQKSEYEYFRKDLALFCYLHLAASEGRELIEAALESKGTFIAYETIEKDGEFPLLKPMSEIAGKAAFDYGNWYLKNPQGTKRKFPEKVLIIGGGTVGESAALKSLNAGCSTVILEKNPKRIKKLNNDLNCFEDSVKVLESNESNITENIKDSDIVIGSIYTAGERAKRIVKESYLNYAENGTVFVDVAIDQGGCFEFSKVTNIKEPSFTIEKNGKEIIVICVPNIPATVGATATRMINEATKDYVIQYAKSGLEEILKDEIFKKGVNIYDGKITYKSVADSHNLSDKFSSL